MPASTEPILVVEDDPDIRDALRELLRDAGYATADATDGQAGLDYLASHRPPPLVLLDWNMSPVDGAAFVARAGDDAALRQIPVVVMTADTRVSQKMVGKSVAGFLAKPIDLDKLFALLDTYCR
jgi:CheY-like chemotaxis protein